MENFVKELVKNYETNRKELNLGYEDGVDTDGVSIDIDIPEREIVCNQDDIDCYNEPWADPNWVSPIDFWSYYDQWIYIYNDGYPTHNPDVCINCGEEEVIRGNIICESCYESEDLDYDNLYQRCFEIGSDQSEKECIDAEIECQLIMNQLNENKQIKQ